MDRLERAVGCQLQRLVRWPPSEDAAGAPPQAAAKNDRAQTSGRLSGRPGSCQPAACPNEIGALEWLRAVNPPQEGGRAGGPPVRCGTENGVRYADLPGGAQAGAAGSWKEAGDRVPSGQEERLEGRGRRAIQLRGAVVARAAWAGLPAPHLPPDEGRLARPLVGGRLTDGR